MIFTIIETVVVSFLVGFSCYQWGGYQKAMEKRKRIHQQEIAE